MILFSDINKNKIIINPNRGFDLHNFKMATMAELLQLIQQDIPEGRRHLYESHGNLEKVAQYCEGNYLQVSMFEVHSFRKKAVISNKHFVKDHYMSISLF